MAEAYWEKYLRDCSVEIGPDELIQSGKASWTKGRQDIIKALITFNDTCLSLHSPPRGARIEWKQLDGYIAQLDTGETRRVNRELWCKNTQCYKFVNQDHFNHFTLEDHPGKTVSIPIPEDKNWVVAQIDEAGTISVRFEK